MAEPQRELGLPESQRLGVETMDRTHAEAHALFMAALAASRADFPAAFAALRHHTEQHFADEERLMAQIGHGLLFEHRGEHQRLLGEMARFAERIARGSTVLAQAWLTQQFPYWFDRHIQSMDAALAAHIKKDGG